MRMYVAHTFEVDDPELAVEELLAALPMQEAQGKNCVGIAVVHTDAVASHVVSAICQAMPFDVVGMTSFASSVNGVMDMGVITISLFVGEEVRFVTGLTGPLDANYAATIAETYSHMRQELGEEPVLTLAYAPFLTEPGGQEMTDCLTKLIHNTPLFGALASDHTPDVSQCYVFRNGQCVKDGLALVCMAGPIEPTFYFTSLLADSVQNKKATITAAKGNTIYSVNDLPVANYLYSLGLNTDACAGAGVVIPFLVDYHDGSPLVARELLGVTPEKHIYFGGEMPEGGSIYLALQTPDEVLRSTRNLMQDVITNTENLDALLVVNCVGRSLILGMNPLGEAEEVSAALGSSVPYHQIYARGELCPAYLPQGNHMNRFHNFSFMVCALKKIS